MTLSNPFKPWRFTLWACVFLIATYVLPYFTNFMWLDIVAKIREAINSGDSGPLIMASAIYSIANTAQNVTAFLAAFSLAYVLNQKRALNYYALIAITLCAFSVISYSVNSLHLVPWEAFTSGVSALIVMLLIKGSYHTQTALYRTTIIAVMVFFAFQWLNMMPVFSKGLFGVTDIPISVKIAAQYLQGDAILTFVGFAFYIPLFMSALMTSMLFMSFDKNIAIANENHVKEIALEAMRASAFEQRVFLEITSIAHDLKTPLVTIRGLNSLLAMTDDSEKRHVYTERIDSAVEKMSDMITGFLFESSRKPEDVGALIDYVRAQIPLGDHLLNVNVYRQTLLPRICVNKVRVSRAILNVLDNAINAKCMHSVKEIGIFLSSMDTQVMIVIKDNGTGIAKERIEDIWEMGYSEHQSSGLGLYFVKKIIEENGGSIAIESVINDGTTVTITFPAYER